MNEEADSRDYAEHGERQPVEAQCEALLDLKPTAVSSIMGVFAPSFVDRLKERGIPWFATATTLAEARAAATASAMPQQIAARP